MLGIRRAMCRMEALEDEDRVAVFSYDSHLKFRLDFTNRKSDIREAIRSAIAELSPGDVLLIAGKGHETGQIVGKQVFPFSDHEAVAAALETGGVA